MCAKVVIFFLFLVLLQEIHHYTKTSIIDNDKSICHTNTIPTLVSASQSAARVEAHVHTD